MRHIIKRSLSRYLVFLAVTALTLVAACKKKDNGGGGSSSAQTTSYVYPRLPDYVSPPNIPVDNPETVEGIALGRMLFYDSSLSVNNTVACASCHHQAYAFTDRGRPVSFGVDDSMGTKNSMALFNIPWERGPFFWNGRAPILDSQIVGPVANTAEMHFTWPGVVAKLQAGTLYPPLYAKAFGSSTITKENTVKAIAQFLRSIVSFSSKYDSVQQHLASFTQSEQRGYQLFTSDPQVNTTGKVIDSVLPGHRLKGSGLDCFHCHANPNFIPELNIPTSEVMQNDGLGTINLKVPSLRNLKFSAPYMSDGSFPSLDSVINHYDHGVNPNDPNVSPLMYAVKYTATPGAPDQLVTPHMELSVQEKADLVAFLNTLNDYGLLTNKAYSNPFHP